MNWKHIFNINNTDIPFYNDMLKNPSYFRRNKGLTFKIKMMTPEQYFNIISKLHNVPKWQEYLMVSQTIVRSYIDRALAGDKFPIPVIDYAKKTQEGRHRVYMAQILGVKKIPVMMVREI